jgi:hypothetical protein
LHVHHLRELELPKDRFELFRPENHFKDCFTVHDLDVLESILAHLVILLPGSIVDQNLISMANLLELLFRLGVIFTYFVWVSLPGKLVISLFDI